jgi:hypothetical protein
MSEHLVRSAKSARARAKLTPDVSKRAPEGSNPAPAITNRNWETSNALRGTRSRASEVACVAPEVTYLAGKTRGVHWKRARRVTLGLFEKNDLFFLH